MSFTKRVIEELIGAEQGKTCCRKATVCGLFWGASLLDGKVVSAEFSSAEAAEYAAGILTKNFFASPEIKRTGRAGRYWYSVTAQSKALWALLQNADNEADARVIPEIAGFKCEECAHAFSKGAFIALGHINDPRKSYHLEFLLSPPVRAKRLADFLSSQVGEIKTIQREHRMGIYYKRNMLITDLLYHIRAMKTAFDYSDICIENEIRNRETRATNFVASNISKSVEASQRQITAIEELVATGAMLKLPEEIIYTARLRIENPDATLSELARLHEPPISKSGLNRRLNRILEEWE